MESITAEVKTNGANQINRLNKFRFAEFVVSGITNRNKIIDIFNLNKNDYENTTDSYLSMFVFNDNFKTFVDLKKSVSGYPGEVSFNYIYVDFDCKENIELAKQDLLNFITYGLGQFLNEKEFEQLKIYFSGGKGFHLGLPKKFFTNIKPTKDLNKRVKAFVHNLSMLVFDETGSGLTTIDLKIYNKDRVLRLPNTINSKTGLYKIPLTFIELNELSIDEIKSLAKSKREIEIDSNIYPNEQLTESFYSVEIESNVSVSQTTKYNGDLFEPGVKDKDRNERGFSLVKKFQNYGTNAEGLKEILKHWNKLNADPLPEHEIVTILKSVSRYDNGINSREIGRADFMNFDDRKINYAEYIKDIQNKKIDIGFEMIDQKIRGIRPGNVLTLLAETGIGKSAIVQNILQNYTKKTDKHTLYVSLEMDSYELFERECQIEFDVSGYDVENSYLKDTAADYNSLHLNKFITLTDSIDINKLSEIVEKCKEYFGEIGLIAIDHVGLVANQTFNDSEYTRITDCMKKIKQFALCSKYPVCVISQVNRMEALKKSDRLSLFSGKGSGEVENSSNVVLALEKITGDNFGIFKYKDNVINADVIESYFQKGLNLLCLTILKNRRGGYLQSILEYDRRNLRIIESDLNKKVMIE